MKPYFTVSRKVAIGYLVIIAFNLLAVGYALVSLHDHNQRTEQLVGVQFRAFNLLRDARQNLLAQENLEKQLIILRDPQLLVLLERRAADFEDLLVKIRNAELPDYFNTLPVEMDNYIAEAEQLRIAFAGNHWDQASSLTTTSTTPLRSELLEFLSDLRAQHQTALDKELHELSLQSNRAYQLTLIITLIGIILSAPIKVMIRVSW